MNKAAPTLHLTASFEYGNSALLIEGKLSDKYKGFRARDRTTYKTDASRLAGQISLTNSNT